MVKITLQPRGLEFSVPRGTALQDVLFAHGVEFPCGGRGRCRGCKVRVIAGPAPVTDEQAKVLSPAEIEAGWRLACRITADADLTLELAQWEAAILADHSVFAFTPREGLGVAVDVGTTTLVAQLLDLPTSHVLGVRTALNAQAQHGADIMSRVHYALTDEGRQHLTQLIRRQIGQLVKELLDQSRVQASRLVEITLVGNTVMHHLFCGENLQPLSQYPFESDHIGSKSFSAEQLGWSDAAQAQVRFLPCLGGFVGSDILAGILATRLHASPELAMLIDLGTNGEIVVGNRERLLCASTAAGPAFEGARISMGMRAATGAISEVRLENGEFACRVVGQGTPRGICGSGLVDAVAVSLEREWIQPSGRLTRRNEDLLLCPPVKLTQADVRELQLAKGAIAAGIRILLDQWGAAVGDVRQVFLAGAFGNYINVQSARRIGLFDFTPEQIEPAGNTALLGAKLALFETSSDPDYADLVRRIQHRSLSAHPQFEDIYLEAMAFPG